MKQRSFDVVVIGGGVAGTSCLYHLAERGVTNTLLIEGDGIASGSSGRSAAFIETQYLDHDRVRLTVYGESLLERFADERRLPFVQTGRLLLARDEEQLSSYGTSIEFQHSIGHYGSKLLRADEIPSITPRLAVDDVVGALFGPRDGYTDPVLLCQLLADLAVERGASVCRETVTGLMCEAGKVVGVRCNGEDIPCGAVINAAGVWARDVGALAGVLIPVDGFVREILILEDPDNVDAGHLPLVIEPTGSDGDAFYCRGDGGRLILAGFHSHKADQAPADPSNYRQIPSSEVSDLILDGVAQRYQGSDALLVRGGWTGLYPVPPDELPIMGESAKTRGLWHAAGLAGNGIQLAPGVGAAVADLMTEGKTAVVADIERYSPERFLVQ